MNRDNRSLLLVSLMVLGSGCVEVPIPDDLGPSAPVERATVQVRVEDAQGAAVEGAWALLTPVGRDGQTDAEGFARLVAVAPGATEVTARALGFMPSEPQLLVVPETGTAFVTVRMTSQSRGVLRVEAHSPDGSTPVAGATVVVDGVESGVTDEDGVARVLEVVPGTVALRVAPPPGTTLLPFVSSPSVSPGATARIAFEFAARSPDGAGHGGSSLCEQCHAGEHDAWSRSAHAQARRSAGRVEIDGPPALVTSFASGDVVPLGPAAAGAEVVLGRSGPGEWTAELRQGATSTGPLRVMDIYGGHSAGFAFAVEHQGTRRVLPIGWSVGPRDPVSADPAPGWVAAWTDGWFPGGLLASNSPGPETSFDLRCAGCHAVGFAIEEGVDRWDLVASGDAPAPERGVGCEACHGPGADHAAAADGRALLIHQPGRQPAGLGTRACARCHQRAEGDVHPLSAAPGLPLDGFAEPPRPWDDLLDVGVPAPDTFPNGASRVHRDQVTALASSPHLGDRTGDCLDCHDPHGSVYLASLRADPEDDGLCVACHRARFPDDGAEQAHAAHPAGAVTSCVDCHMAPSGLVLRRDAISGAGEGRDHGLVPWTADDVLAVFDGAGAAQLPIADVPVNACASCHLRAQARAADQGLPCDCAVGDPTLRTTWVDQQAVHAAWAGVSQ